MPRSSARSTSAPMTARIHETYLRKELQDGFFEAHLALVLQGASLRADALSERHNAPETSAKSGSDSLIIARINEQRTTLAH